ncbi:MAG: SRPBCC family protein [Promethearchaeota archaeon]
MKILKDSIEIRTTPDKIFEWFIHFTENYNVWHPDHVKACWVKGKPWTRGSILYVEEYMHGDLHKIKFKAIKIDPNKRIEYKMLFPTSFICPKGSFIIEPNVDSCIFTATISFRFGWLLSRFAKNRIEAFKKHLKEEGENLKRLLEEG